MVKEFKSPFPRRLWRVIRTDHPDRMGSASQVVRARTRFGAGLIARAGHHRKHGWTVTVKRLDD